MATQRQFTAIIELFFEEASPEEVGERLHDEVFITRLEIAFARTTRPFR